MALQIQGNGGVVADVGGTTFRAFNINVKPIEYGALGHYRVTHTTNMLAAQVVNSRVFELRNSHATNLIVPTRLVLKWIQTAAHTAQVENSLDVYKLNTFTANSTANIVTPTAVVKRTGTMAAAPGAASIRGLTIAGNVAGMTGGAQTKEGGAIVQLPRLFQAAVPTANDVLAATLDTLDDVNGTHPFVLAQNEGILVEIRSSGAAAAGSKIYIDCSWVEVTAY